MIDLILDIKYIPPERSRIILYFPLQAQPGHPLLHFSIKTIFTPIRKNGINRKHHDRDGRTADTDEISLASSAVEFLDSDHVDWICDHSGDIFKFCDSTKSTAGWNSLVCIFYSSGLMLAFGDGRFRVGEKRCQKCKNANRYNEIGTFHTGSPLPRLPLCLS